MALCLTLVTLDCTPFDIAMNRRGEDDAVYPPWVLHRRDQPKHAAARTDV